MAFYLKSDGINDYVSLATTVSIPTGTAFKIEIEMQAIDGADFGVRVFGAIGSSTGRFIVFKGDNPNAVVPWGTIATSGGVNILNRSVWSLERDASNIITIAVDGAVMPGTINSGTGSTFNTLLTELSETNARNPLNLYSMKVWIAGVLTHHWDPSASGGTGTTLIDVVGGNNGTLINYTNDADAWEFYSAGITPIAFTGTIPSFSFTAGDAVSVDLSTYFSGTETPFTFANTGTALTGSGLTLSSAGLLSGTYTDTPITGVIVTGTDTATNTASSNDFNIETSAAVAVTATVSIAMPQMSVSASASVPAANPAITSEPLKNNTGALLANQALDYVAIYDNTTGALVLRVTGVSTDASGVFTVSDAALTAGVTYKLDWKVTAQSAARMPAKAAV